jgi:hypothetical protein
VLELRRGGQKKTERREGLRANGEEEELRAKNGEEGGAQVFKQLRFAKQTKVVPACPPEASP